jgi:hypothetical protein
MGEPLFLSGAWRRSAKARGYSVLWLLAILVAASWPGSAVAYTFTGNTGTKVEAEIVSVSLANQTVRLRLPTGKEADVPFANVSEADRVYLRQWTPPASAVPATPAPKSSLLPGKPSTDPVGAPGETVTIEFPELAKDRQEHVAAMKIRLPDKYDPTKPMPLLLWFTPGEGSNEPKGGMPLVDPATWAIAAMPYPNTTTTPQHAVVEGKMNIIRDYHMTMLKKLKSVLPNVDPKLRFAAGFSNGAHCVGTYLAEGEKEFIEYFNGYVIIEGGCTRTDAKKTLRNQFAYVAWGTAAGNTEGYMGSMKAALKDGHLKVTDRGMPNVGHGFPGVEQAEVKTWIEKVAVPGILAAKS